MAAKDVEDTTETEGAEAPSPMLDMSQAAVKKMIAQAKSKGYITLDELNRALPPDQVSSEQIEDVMALLSEMGVNVVEEEEADPDEGGDEAKAESREVVAATTTGTESDRTDDPVRMYLREMGTVELLSREGEIAIAKRIEAGRATMIGGLCESPLTFQAITIWLEELNDERIMLRDVIDLETTFGKGMEDDEDEAVDLAEPAAEQPQAEGQGPRPELDDGEEPDEQANLSLSAMEAALRPQVLEKLERISADYARLHDMQSRRIGAALSESRTFSSAQELEYQRLRSEIVELVNSLNFHNNRIETLVDQLYGINRRLMNLEGQLVKIADYHKVNRREFIDE
ncbi:MAG: RNA polymerase sigma factor region1.1 domain-containing protein, partial [Rubrimonas sp.]